MLNNKWSFRVIVTVLSLFHLRAPFAQTPDNSPFEIYVKTDHYDEDIQEYIKSKDYFKPIKIMTGAMIDPYKKNEINIESIQKYITKLSPDTGDSGVLCLNVENKLYQNLRDFSADKKEFGIALEELRKMVLTVKKERPNLKVGIYGLPYKTYYKSQRKWNSDNKLDELLSHCDYLFPSVYIYYPDKEKGKSANDDFLSQNLRTAFEYGERLNKPVIPFIWYMVHPSNKKHGGELLSVDEMNRYFNFIKDYKWKSHQVKGVVWWESSPAYLKRYAKVPGNMKSAVTRPDYNLLFSEYMKNLRLKDH